MRIRNILLYNFGSYEGETIFDNLTTDDNKNIILIGGMQSPCRKFSGRGFICVYKKLTKEITEKLQNPIAKWFQKSYNMVTARANDPAECEIFFFLFFWDIGHRFSSSGCSPSQS